MNVYTRPGGSANWEPTIPGASGFKAATSPMRPCRGRPPPSRSGAPSQQLPAPALETIEFLGELALTGELRAIRGVLPCALQAQRAGHDLVVPHDNANEAALVNGLSVFPARHLLEVCAHINRSQPLLPYSLQGNPSEDFDGVDFSDVRSQTSRQTRLGDRRRGRA